MQPSQHFPGIAPLGPPRPLSGEAEFVAGWMGHLAAGRVGGHLNGPDAALPEGRPPLMSAAELATQRHNEMVVLGHTPSFPSAASSAPARQGVR